MFEQELKILCYFILMIGLFSGYLVTKFYEDWLPVIKEFIDALLASVKKSLIYAKKQGEIENMLSDSLNSYGFEASTARGVSDTLFKNVSIGYCGENLQDSKVFLSGEFVFSKKSRKTYIGCFVSRYKNGKFYVSTKATDKIFGIYDLGPGGRGVILKRGMMK